MKASSESGECARTSVWLMRCLRSFSARDRSPDARSTRSRGTGWRAGEKTSHVKKKILDSWSKLSTILFSKKKGRRGDLESLHRPYGKPRALLKIDRQRKFQGSFGSRQIQKTRGSRPSRGGQPSTRLSGLSIKSAKRR